MLGFFLYFLVHVILPYLIVHVILDFFCYRLASLMNKTITNMGFFCIYEFIVTLSFFLYFLVHVMLVFFSAVFKSSCYVRLLVTLSVL